MKKQLKTIAASVSALCIAASLCTSLTASAITLYPKTVMTKSSYMWNSCRNETIKLEYCTSKSDYQDYLYEPGRNIRTVSTSSAPGHTVNVNYNDILGAYTGSYEYWQASQCGLYNVEKAYDFYSSIGYTPTGLYVAINDHSTYVPGGNGGQRENAWALGDTLFFGLGSSDQSQEDAVKFLGSATDVVTHEYGHLVTQATFGWNDYSQLSPEAAALSEAYSDIFAELADEKNDWKVGATVFTKNGCSKPAGYYSYRDIANPANTHNPKTPNTTYYTNYSLWNAAVNANPYASDLDTSGSTIISHVAYTMAQSSYFVNNKQLLAKIWLRSLSKYNVADTTQITFRDCRYAFLDAAYEVLSEEGIPYYQSQALHLITAFNGANVF